MPGTSLFLKTKAKSGGIASAAGKSRRGAARMTVVSPRVKLHQLAPAKDAPEPASGPVSTIRRSARQSAEGMRRARRPSLGGISWDQLTGDDLGDEDEMESVLRGRMDAVQRARKERGEFNWVEAANGTYVKLPPGTPAGVVHLLGGALVGGAPQVAYDGLAESIAREGNFVVIATPYHIDIDHTKIARDALADFEQTLASLGDPVSGLPVYGVGHSVGAKLQALISCETNGDGGGPMTTMRTGNVLISYNSNNSSTDTSGVLDSICSEILERTPEIAACSRAQMLLNGLPKLSGLAGNWAAGVRDECESRPSAEQTAGIVSAFYDVPRTRVIGFERDSIDQSESLVIGGDANRGTWSGATLPGNHLTPVSVELTADALPCSSASGTDRLMGLGNFASIRLGDDDGVRLLGLDVVRFLRGGADTPSLGSSEEEVAMVDAVGVVGFNLPGSFSALGLRVDECELPRAHLTGAQHAQHAGKEGAGELGPAAPLAPSGLALQVEEGMMLAGPVGRGAASSRKSVSWTDGYRTMSSRRRSPRASRSFSWRKGGHGGPPGGADREGSQLQRPA